MPMSLSNALNSLILPALLLAKTMVLFTGVPLDILLRRRLIDRLVA
jgi:hypothetical protein